MAGEQDQDQRTGERERVAREERRRVEPEREAETEPQVEYVREELRRHDSELRPQDGDDA